VAVILLLSAEIFFHVKKYEGLTGIEYNHNEIWNWKGNLDYQSRSEEGYPTIVHTDKFGFRNHGKTIEKPKDVIRIVIIGDSYTEGLGYSDNQIFTALLEQSLAGIKPGGKKIEVIGASSPAWSTEQELRCLMNEAKLFQPDYVLLMVCPNDIREAYCKKFVEITPNGQLKFNAVNFNSSEIFKWKLAGHSYLYQYAQKKWFHSDYGEFSFLARHYKFNFGKEDSSDWDRPVYLKSAFPELADARKLFVRLLDEMNSECKKDNIHFAVSVVPLVIEFDSTMVKDTALQSGLVSDMLQRYSDSAHVDYVNLYDRFKSAPDPTTHFLKSDLHFNKKGHVATAAGLTDYYKKVFHSAAGL